MSCNHRQRNESGVCVYCGDGAAPMRTTLLFSVDEPPATAVEFYTAQSFIASHHYTAVRITCDGEDEEYTRAALAAYRYVKRGQVVFTRVCLGNTAFSVFRGPPPDGWTQEAGRSIVVNATMTERRASVEFT